ncbi:MAG: hypothetical protein GF309_16315 [Candidatus Lokiarchaeota archaeon]|nr:hypothetical protein [Candidatus Lokiarchaeota archaeon]
MRKPVLPEEMAGTFFGVGSVGETDPRVPVEYVQQLEIPYAYQIPSLREEDMIRQFGYLIDGFEENDEDFVLDLGIDTFRSVMSSDTPMIPDCEHFHSLYLLLENSSYPVFKTQQTAPATMCYSTRGPEGGQYVSKQMLQFYTALMKRIANGQKEHLESKCDRIILCQDDPALGFVLEMNRNDPSIGLSLSEIWAATESVFPHEIIPAYHYCHDWRSIGEEDSHPIFESDPLIFHMDLLSYPPSVGSTLAEMMNGFMKKGGGLALGLIPNTDDSLKGNLMAVVQENLESTMEKFSKSGVDLDLLSRNAMISTVCGLSGASKKMTREIHHRSREFPNLFVDVISSF